jgi:hypothetical protein
MPLPLRAVSPRRGGGPAAADPFSHEPPRQPRRSHACGGSCPGAPSAWRTSSCPLRHQGRRPLNRLGQCPLRLCAAMQWDPCPELPHAMIPPGDFDFTFFSMAIFMKRGLNGHTEAQAAQIMNVSPHTVKRIEIAHRQSIGVVISGCKYLNLHPFSYALRPEIQNGN